VFNDINLQNSNFNNFDFFFFLAYFVLGSIFSTIEQMFEKVLHTNDHGGILESSNLNRHV
jgi:hypothetical protein